MPLMFPALAALSPPSSIATLSTWTVALNSQILLNHPVYTSTLYANVKIPISLPTKSKDSYLAKQSRPSEAFNIGLLRAYPIDFRPKLDNQLRRPFRVILSHNSMYLSSSILHRYRQTYLYQVYSSEGYQLRRDSRYRILPSTSFRTMRAQ